VFVDSRTLDDGAVVDAEVCIIGGGAAGITLALELADQPFRVVMIESGGFDFEEQTDDLRRAINTGHPYSNLPISRLRYFGGSTNHWGGHCAPMRALNFEHRPWIPYSGWPFPRQDLEPYYLRAHDIVRLGEFDYDPVRTAAAMDMSLFPFDPSRVETVMSRYNALQFGDQYRQALDTAKNLTTYLWGNVVNIDRHPINPFVSQVSVRTLTGKNFTVRGRYFILALGGIDNARMLLLSDDVEAAGLGNANDLVGRFFMEHIWYLSGTIVQSGPQIPLGFYRYEHPLGDVGVRGHIALPEDLVRKLEIPEYRAELRIRRSASRSTDAGYYYKKWLESLSNFKWPDDLGNQIMRVVTDLDDVAGHLVEGDFPFAYQLENYVEQVPNPDSRIDLAPERDALDLPRAAVHWQLSELDKTGIRKAQEVIASEVGRSGFGRMRIEMPEEEEIILKDARGGAHHMGTTRMHNDPRQGVVDSDCRIHGLGNFYVAGSSVFPTGGYINPTLTIVAMTIRLGDHIKLQMNA
jgi:choline dehydrogenase-like flavoprotein